MARKARDIGAEVLLGPREIKRGDFGRCRKRRKSDPIGETRRPGRIRQAAALGRESQYHGTDLS